MFVQILPHKAMATDEKSSGVQTSEGDKFSGEVVDLPASEAGLLIAMDRAKEVEAPAKPKKSA